MRPPPNHQPHGFHRARLCLLLLQRRRLAPTAHGRLRTIRTRGDRTPLPWLYFRQQLPPHAHHVALAQLRRLLRRRPSLAQLRRLQLHHHRSQNWRPATIRQRLAHHLPLGPPLPRLRRPPHLVFPPPTTRPPPSQPPPLRPLLHLRLRPPLHPHPLPRVRHHATHPLTTDHAQIPTARTHARARAGAQRACCAPGRKSKIFSRFSPSKTAFPQNPLRRQLPSAQRGGEW